MRNLSSEDHEQLSFDSKNDFDERMKKLDITKNSADQENSFYHMLPVMDSPFDMN